MSSEEIAISVRNLTKCFRIFGHAGDRIKQAFTLGRIKFHREFTAIRDVSFDIKKGETIGIVGCNGSGKSTLLQLICGILKPSSGSVLLNGRVSALLELGAGFNPEFTGRENVYFQGALMGFTEAEVNARFNDIEVFADIGEFIDQPVRTYSSGMFVRLAFSVAIHSDPDILIVDEALSVGDAVYQHKCMNRVRKMVEMGTTLLLVSHDRNLITSSCVRCILMEAGQVAMDDSPSNVFDYYYAVASTKRGAQIERSELDSGLFQVTSGTREATVESIRILDASDKVLDVMEVGKQVAIEFVVSIRQVIPRLILGFSIRDQLGQIVFSTNTSHYGKTLDDLKQNASYMFKFLFQANMGVGSYSISTLLVGSNDRFACNYESRELACFFEIENRTHPVFRGNTWLNPALVVNAR